MGLQSFSQLLVPVIALWFWVLFGVNKLHPHSHCHELGCFIMPAHLSGMKSFETLNQNMPFSALSDILTIMKWKQLDYFTICLEVAQGLGCKTILMYWVLVIKFTQGTWVDKYCIHHIPQEPALTRDHLTEPFRHMWQKWQYLPFFFANHSLSLSNSILWIN